MKSQHYQKILAELEQNDFPEILNIVRKSFRQKHEEEEVLAHYELTLRHEWRYGSKEYLLDADEVMPLLRGVPEESLFCLVSILLTPVIVYKDASGEEKKFRLNAVTFSNLSGRIDKSIYYDGHTQAHWQELRLRVEGGKEQAIPRGELFTGLTLAQLPSGPLTVVCVDQSSLVLMLGNDFAELIENREFLWDCLPGVEAGLYYDHEEYPALWSWLYIDDETEGESTPWYCRRHEEKKNLWEGMDYIKDDPNVKIVKISNRSLTLSISFGLQGHLQPREIVLDQPNREVVIWKSGKRSLKAELYVTEPHKREMRYFDDSETVPSGCRVSVSIVGKDKETLENTFAVDVRSLPCSLKGEIKDGIFWNWLDVWGFLGGKMVVGVDNPRFNSGSCAFRGLLAPGKPYTFPIDDDDGDEERVHQGQITISWETIEVQLEIKDGELMSIPDVTEIVIPEEVRKMHYQSLLSAPSLRKITLRPGIERFYYALDEFHDEIGVKLDVVYEGTLQEWFDTARGLAKHVGRLIIQGKEYTFYETDDVVIPEGVSRIGDDFFCNSAVIRTLVLPPSVVDVGNHAFAYCDQLESVKVLGPADIGCDAFISCHALRDIYLADGVVSLGDGCFDFLTKVESIFIPKSVKKVGILSEQNDGSYRAPKFLCEAPSKPSGWNKNWNLSYYDPRFGLGQGYDHFHPVKWGAVRDER